MGEILRLGFEDDDEEERPPAPAPPTAAPISGHADGVTVVVDESAEVRTVSLAPRWREALDPRWLGQATLSAANEATLHALARQVEQSPDPAPERPPAPPQAPITRQDAARLLDAATADLAAFTERLTRATGPVAAESRGGHVHGTAHGGRVTTLEVDPHWANRARDSELTAELREVLLALRAPADLAAGPDSPAVARLTALARDPDTLLRGLGLLP